MSRPAGSPPPCVDCAVLATRGGEPCCRQYPCDCSCHAPSKFEVIGAQLGRLVSAKQAAYGDSFGKAGSVMRILYPEGIKLDQLDDALTLVRIIDKLFRVATDRDALGESPFRDIAGYSLLAVARTESRAAVRSIVAPRPPPTSAPSSGAVVSRP